MKRRHTKTIAVVILAVLLFCGVGCEEIRELAEQGPNTLGQKTQQLVPKAPNTPEKVIKTKAEWREILTPDQYEVMRRRGTEEPFSGKYDRFFKDGTYRCVGCGNVLFRSETKFDAGCGWPSFRAPADANSIDKARDRSHWMIRTAVLCSRCGAHLGHVFKDGPKPTGLRYCINSIALNFEDKQDKTDPNSPAPDTDKEEK